MIELELQKPHENQMKIATQGKRFNVVCCGRRFGKTDYGIHRLILLGLEGYPVAWFAPSYRMLKEVWDKVIITLQPLIKRKDSQQKNIELLTGGKIDFWSLDSPHYVRGRKYKHIIIDETAHVKDLENTWQMILRPLLTDYIGSCDFLSTPNGKHNYFFTLFERCFDPGFIEDWQAFQMPTLSNPFISPSEVETARKELDSLTFHQEYLAEFVDFVSKPFAYAFIPERHIKPTTYNPALPLWFCFDFGVDPMPCIVVQVDKHNFSIRVLHEFTAYNSNIYQVCNDIKAYCNTFNQRPFIMVTGDPSGASRSPLTDGTVNAYQIIQSELNLHPDSIEVPKKFSIENSRTLCNSFMQHRTFEVSPDCEKLIRDLKYVEINTMQNRIKLQKTGKNKSGNQNESLTHYLDALRYLIHLNFYDMLRF